MSRLERPIFVVGCPRSGTTLVQCILSASSQAFSLPETHFFTWVLPAIQAQPESPVTARQIEAIKESLEAEAELVVPDSFWSDLRCRAPATALDVFVELVEHFSPRPGLRAIEKTPRHVLCLDVIGSAFPDARFVNVVRDPIDVASSLLGVPFESSRSVLSYAQRWTESVHAAEVYAQAQPGRLRTVVYESLVAQPEATVRDLCTFVDLAYEPAMLEEFGHEAARNVGRGEAWKHEVKRGVIVDRSGVWRSRMTPGQAWLVAQATRDLRSDYGYLDRPPAAAGSIAAALASEARIRFHEARSSTGRGGRRTPRRRRPQDAIGSMSKPHVLYITPLFGYPAFGGPRLRTYNTLRALARCADVSLYLTQQPDTTDVTRARAHLLEFCRDVVFPDPPPPASIARRALHAAVPGRVRAALRRRRPQRSSEPSPATARDPSVVAALRAWIAAHGPDVIWLGFGGISYDLLGLKHASRARLVLETESVWSRFLLRELPFEPDPQRREQIVRAGQAKAEEERLGALEADLTTAVSDVDAAYFRSLAPEADRVMLLANVIDVDAYAADTGSVRLEQPAVLFAGTLSQGTANVDAARWLLDEVMPRVWAARPDAHLYLVGRSPAPAVLARRGTRVHVTGEVASIVPYMRASAAAVVPLRWESGTRFKILEAFACRTAVVSTSLGAEGLDVQHGRHLLLADEPASFAAAVVSLIEQPALRASLVEPALALVRQEYDLSSAERQINAILARLGLGETAGV